MGTSDKRKPAQKTTTQLFHEVKALRASHEQLRAQVSKLKDILQVQDNWHSNIASWVNGNVQMLTDDGVDVVGKLLWTDRYNLGLEIDGEKSIYNKGHVIRIKRS